MVAQDQPYGGLGRALMEDSYFQLAGWSMRGVQFQNR